ncbi:hypothetical protein [Lysobacter capsici]|uniref:hypothetical protein n=1 Tax=Lysobacter capsici TaxID=435897 RepID=UPI0012FD19B0|nr:hypothetical protein [Lysobacter capsici]
MKSVLRFSIQVIFAISLMLIFFSLAPWLAAAPVSELRAEPGFEKTVVPIGAKSYVISHGAVVFRASGTIAQEPFVFGAICVAFITNFIFLALSFSKASRKIL